MITLAFVAGSSLRRVTIDERVISFLVAENNFVPIQVDLDKINSDKEIQKKLGKENVKLLKEIALLKTEEDMAQDVIRDFQRTGWRRISKNASR